MIFEVVVEEGSSDKVKDVLKAALAEAELTGDVRWVSGDASFKNRDWQLRYDAEMGAG